MTTPIFPIVDDPVVGARQGVDRLRAAEIIRALGSAHLCDHYRKITFNRRLNDQEVSDACHWLHARIIEARLMPSLPHCHIYEDWAWTRSPELAAAKGSPYTSFYFAFKTEFFDVEFKLRYV